MLTNILSLCGALILPWPLMPQNGQVENNEVRKPKYGNRSTGVEKPPITVYCLGICYFHNTWCPPCDLTHIHAQNLVLRTWRRVLLSQDVEDNTDNIQSQDKHWGRLGISQKVLSQALAIGLWRIYISAMQHTSEHNTCSVEIRLNTLLCCMCITQCWQQLSL